MGMHIQQLYTNCLAEAAYYVESEGEAAVIDPVRETTPYLQLAQKRGAKIKFVFETHFHADFVSGHIDLANQTGAQIIFGPQAATAYTVHNAVDGEEFALGSLKIRALHTPGHTPESTCYLLLDSDGKPHAVFTGDTLFVGDVGRPDLLDGVMTREDLAGMLYESLNKKIKTLPDEVLIYPAHGPGSACGKSIGKETFSTVGTQKKMNYALQDMTKEEFVGRVTEGIEPPPAYFFEDAKINKVGYVPVDEVVKKNLKPLRREDFSGEAIDGAMILDTRDPADFAAGFIPGSVNIGLGGSYAVWVGTLLDIHKPLVLVTAPGREEESILRLARVGYERVHGYLGGGIRSWTENLDTIPSVQARALDTVRKEEDAVVDVRRRSEWDAGAVTGSIHKALSGIPNNLSGLDQKKKHYVYCATGYRSMIASSLMRRAGFPHVINVAGGYKALRGSGAENMLETISE